jgi:hypothetical protein
MARDQGRAQRLRSKGKAIVDPADCTHHWLIEPPSGSSSSGACKFCGATRMFATESQLTTWGLHRGRQAAEIRALRTRSPGEFGLADERV